ncbi:MAG: hypothetical protein OEY66_07940 [Gammaproteobacteria bacterium]|nr:hypothetical protein [Gammaproteobacteria bacterium]
MKYQKFFLCIFLLVNLAGCAFLETNKKKASDIVEQLMQDNEFVSAIFYLDSLPDAISSSKELSEKRKVLTQAMHVYEDKVLAKVKLPVEQGNWKVAIDIYEDALARLPKSSIVFREYESFNELKQRHIYELEIQALVIRAGSLEKIMKIRQSISELDPYSYIKKIKLSLLNSEIESIAGELLEHGVKALEDNEIAIAKRTLPLALRLYDNKEIEAANKRLEKLSKSMGGPLQDLINKGAELYGQERYEEAIVIWQQVLLLDPENTEIKANLERTQRVIENLERLKKSNVKPEK